VNIAAQMKGSSDPWVSWAWAVQGLLVLDSWGGIKDKTGVCGVSFQARVSEEERRLIEAWAALIRVQKAGLVLSRGKGACGMEDV
jgi:hypothetical protein